MVRNFLYKVVSTIKSKRKLGMRSKLKKNSRIALTDMRLRNMIFDSGTPLLMSKEIA